MKRSLSEILRTHIGVVPERPVSPRTHAVRSRLEGTDVGVSVCPYCAVGCSQLVYHRDGKVLSIEGNYESFINGGTEVPLGIRRGIGVLGLLFRSGSFTSVDWGNHWRCTPQGWRVRASSMPNVTHMTVRPGRLNLGPLSRVIYVPVEAVRSLSMERVVVEFAGTDIPAAWKTRPTA